MRTILPNLNLFLCLALPLASFGQAAPQANSANPIATVAGQPVSEQDSDVYKIRIGRSLLLGLEVLVAADIVKTVAHELTFLSLGLLAGLVLVRTFLSWTLVLEIEGRWPWQREPSPMSARARAGDNLDRQ